MWIAPPDGGVPDQGRFAALLGDLIDSGVVASPVYVLSGEAGRDPSAFSIGTVVMREGPIPARITGSDFDFVVHYVGWDRDAIESAVASAPFGSEDICVYFGIMYPGDDPADPCEICDAALFVTCGPAKLVHIEPFVLSESGTLFGYDSDDPDDPYVDGTWQALFAYPIDKALGGTSHEARWFLSAEGKSAWELLPAALRVCARHFGDDHLAGEHTA
jgi:hypothetical protein